MCMYTVCACIGHLHYRYSNLMLLTENLSNMTALGMYTYSTLLKLHILFHSYPDKITVAWPGFVVFCVFASLVPSLPSFFRT